MLCSRSSKFSTLGRVNLQYVGMEIQIYIYKGKRLPCASDSDLYERPAEDHGAPGFLGECQFLHERPKETQCLVIHLYL